jgi:hypothetical protein
MSMGRISQLPRAAITLEKPQIRQDLELKLWKPYIDSFLIPYQAAGQATYSYTLLQKFSNLSNIVNDAIFMFYAPKERTTSRKVLDLYSRAKRWLNTLPDALSDSPFATAHVITLQ